MKHLLWVLCLFSSTLFSNLEAQTNPNSIQLWKLNSKGKALEMILTDINTFIAGKSNGYTYPLSKVVITGYEDGAIEFEIKSIDNSWSNLFTHDEVPYGYIVLNDRLYIISYQNVSTEFLTDLFEITHFYRVFNRASATPSFTSLNPCWYFEYKDSKYIWLGSKDLEALK